MIFRGRITYVPGKNDLVWEIRWTDSVSVGDIMITVGVILAWWTALIIAIWAIGYALRRAR